MLGDKWQVFAAAYELAIDRGGILVGMDRYAATFIYEHRGHTGLSLFSGTQTVTVAVSRIDELSCVVFVDTRASNWRVPQLYDWGEGKRIATRFLDQLETRWAAPLRAMEDADWYPDDSGGQRYWDGRRWTPFLWRRDSPHHEEPGDHPPPMRPPRTLLGSRRYWLRIVRDFAIALVGVAVIVVLLAVR